MSGEHKGGANSAVIIARILGVEGYSNHVHNEVMRWWKRTVMEPRASKKIERLEKEFSKFMEDASEAERLLVGRFIHLRCRQSFDAAFRVGFMGFVHEHTTMQQPTMMPQKETDLRRAQVSQCAAGGAQGGEVRIQTIDMDRDEAIQAWNSRKP